jgi:hypothetical protein
MDELVVLFGTDSEVFSSKTKDFRIFLELFDLYRLLCDNANRCVIRRDPKNLEIANIDINEEGDTLK